MDIRKLQRVIVDGLEDVKAQNIVVFNTEHLSPLFERVVIASGTSNRQTKSLAASVRDAVKKAGDPVPRVEGEENGEWIIVDCGAAVVHVMQPSIREYYHLEELWGEKPVKMKIDAGVRPTRTAGPEAPPDKAPARSRVGARGAGFAAPSRAPSLAPARKAAATRPAARGAGRPVAKSTGKPPVKSAAKTVGRSAPGASPRAVSALAKGPAKAPTKARNAVTRTTGVKRASAPPAAPAAKRTAAPVAAPAAKRTAAPARKVPRKTPSGR